MATVDLNDENFTETIDSNDIVVLDFWAPWCGPCQAFSPIFDEASEKFPDVIFGKINTDEEQKLAAYFGVRGIPTLVIIREQIVIDRTSGVVSAEKLEAAILETQKLDMEEVHKEADEQEKKDEANKH